MFEFVKNIIDRKNTLGEIFMESSQLHANYSTMLLAIIREYSNSFGHSGTLLEITNLSDKELNDIFLGKKELSTDKLLKIFSIGFYYNNNVLENLFNACTHLNSFGYYFQYGNISRDSDHLFKMYTKFFNNKEFISLLQKNGIYYNIGFSQSTFIRYCVDPNFRDYFNNSDYQEIALRLTFNL